MTAYELAASDLCKAERNLVQGIQKPNVTLLEIGHLKKLCENRKQILKALGNADKIEADAIKRFAERLKKELCGIVVIRDIHDEEETDMDSNEVWGRIDKVVKEFTT